MFGLSWSCGTGTGNNLTGCTGTMPAHLDIPWEAARVQRLPKGGILFNEGVGFFVRTAAGTSYRILYTPVSLPSPGASFFATRVTVFSCNNASCSITTALTAQDVTWQRVSEFVSWDLGGSTLNQANPMLSYFLQAGAADASATNSCAGWEPNTDSAADHNLNNYSLLRPTDSSDPRGSFFTVGDMIPLDWNNDHKLDIANRLAPNGTLDPAAPPDYRISAYLNDNRVGIDSFLRLKNENARPLIASGSSPLGAALASFRTWYAGWQPTAAGKDPEWPDRHPSVVLLTDGDDTCGGDPCGQASDLYQMYGVRTFVVAFGAQPVAGGALECAAANGGTIAPYYPQTQQELTDDLAAVYTEAAFPP